MKLRSLELKSIALFYSIVILFPNYEKDTIGFHFGLWMLSATLFLVPIILKNMKYMRFDKYDYGVLALIVCHSVPFIFLGINEGFYEILYGMLCLACPYFAMKYSLHTDDDIAFLYKFIIYSSVIVTVIGIAEFTIQQPLYDTLFGIENPDNVGYFRREHNYISIKLLPREHEFYSSYLFRCLCLFCFNIDHIPKINMEK